MEVKTVYEAGISVNTTLRTEIYEYEGKKYFSFRFFHKLISGKWIAGKKGISLEFKYWYEFQKAFKVLEKELIDNYLVDLDNAK